MRSYVLCALFAAGLCATAILGTAVPGQATYTVRISDLQYSPKPPNPIKVAGRVTSENPLTLSDRKGVVIVTGVTGRTGDFMVVEGNYDGSVLSVSQNPGKAVLYATPGMTEMVHIPAGWFSMGNTGIGDDLSYYPSDEVPGHFVYLSAHWIGRYEVTRGEFGKFMKGGGYARYIWWSVAGWTWREDNHRVEPRYWAAEQNWGTGSFTQTDSHPVVGVSYYEAEAYCRWVGGHLPTEAQWENATRSPLYAHVYPWGSVWDNEKCNNLYDSNPAAGGYQRYQTAPVGSYPSGASPYGLQDTAGNVAEWCRDWYSDSYYSVSPASDPQGPSSGGYRVVRGSGWDGYFGDRNRCAARGWKDVSAGWTTLGFRVAR